MPILGNMNMLDWLVVWLTPIIKSARGKDPSLPHALCALLSSFVKPESKHHAALMEHGYTPFEIAYANMMTVIAQSVDDMLSINSLFYHEENSSRIPLLDILHLQFLEKNTLSIPIHP